MLNQQIDLCWPVATTSTQQTSIITPFGTHKAEVVQFPLRSSELCTSWQPTPLFIYASSLLRQTMNERGLRPTKDHLDGLLAVLKVLCQMAEGSCPSSIHLSSLDPGMGKTTAVVCFLKALRHCPECEDVGVVVFVSRLDEVRKLIVEAGLAQDDFAVLTADEDCNQLSSTPVDQAQVLFTTQQMLSKRGAGRSFSSLQDFYYMGKARAVRVWDETIDPAAVTCPSARDLAGALKPLETVSAQAADDLEQFVDKLKKAAVGTILCFPSFVFSDLEHAKKQFPEVSDVVDALRSLSGAYVKVLKSHLNTKMALHIRDALPRDISPMLVLDASGSVRQTYFAWSEYRGGLIHLPSVRKHYSPLTVHLMKRGGGKDSWRQSSHELAQEVADVINSRPEEKFLVV